nr:MAG TPA: sialate O-acetylesterase [Caudoviricetes sp.]
MQFIDRQAKYPGRWTMKKSDGTSEVVTLVRNDEPIVEGTPMNANTFNSLVALDPTLSLSGKAADAKATGDAVGQLKEDIGKIGTKIVSENLLDYSKIESGYYDLNGVFHESDTYAHVKVYADDLVGKTIYFSRDNVSSIIDVDVSFITEYDSNGSVVRITNAKNTNNYTIPDGVAHIIISATVSNLNMATMITLGFVPEKFIPYFEPYFKANDKFVSDLQLQINDLKGTFTVVECWGDSLTKGVGASENNYENAYPNQLQKMLGGSYVVNNLGIGGEGVKQISARQGGKLSFAQPFTIPEDTVATNVSFLNDDGENIKHQNQKGNGVNPCYIDGVKGTVAWDKSNLTNTFVREARGNEVKITKEMPLVTDGMINHRGNIMVIWAGTNDKPKTKERAQYVIDSIRDMIAYAETDKYIVIGLTSKAYMGDFIDNNTKIWSQNFGTKFVNVRKYLMNYALEDESITPTEQDRIDIENGEIPSSLRATNDPVHLNAKGYHCIARLTHERGKLLGYW